MKFLSIALALMAATAATAAPGRTMQKWCGHPGQGCAKRSAEPEAIAEPVAQKWCAHPGQGCAKVKRTAEAVEEVKRSADALAEAIASMNDEE